MLYNGRNGPLFEAGFLDSRLLIAGMTPGRTSDEIIEIELSVIQVGEPAAIRM